MVKRFPLLCLSMERVIIQRVKQYSKRINYCSFHDKNSLIIQYILYQWTVLISNKSTFRSGCLEYIFYMHVYSKRVLWWITDLAWLVVPSLETINKQQAVQTNWECSGKNNQQHRIKYNILLLLLYSEINCRFLCELKN